MYFVLDDNRLYRRTDPPLKLPPAPKKKSKQKKAKAGIRASKRRKTSEVNNDVKEEEEDEEAVVSGGASQQDDDGFGGRKWECLAINLPEYQNFLASIAKSKDPNEKFLHKRLTSDVMPLIEKLQEAQERKAKQREKELINMEKMASAKRSSRLAGKQERERQEQEAKEAEKKRLADLAAAHKEQEKQRQMEQARESRMMTREQRIKDREYKRLLHEEELARMAEEQKKVEAGEARGSERHLKLEMDRRKKEMEELAQEDEWVFDCSGCGVYGTNIVSCQNLSQLSPMLILSRMTVLIALLARGATSGSTVNAWVSLKQRQSATTFTSSAVTASVERKMQQNLRFHRSNFVSHRLRLLLHKRMGKQTFRRSVRLVMTWSPLLPRRGCSTSLSRLSLVRLLKLHKRRTPTATAPP